MQKENNNVSEKAESKFVAWCNAHKKLIEILSDMLFLFTIVLMLFFTLRAWGVHTMNHYGYYQALQGYTLMPRKSKSFGPFEGQGHEVTVYQNPDIEGCEEMVVVTSKYCVITSRDSQGRGHLSYSLGEEKGYFYRFKNAKLAQKFLSKLGKQEGRHRYAVKKYIYDDPIVVNPENESELSPREEAMYACHIVTFGELAYRIFVAFEGPFENAPRK